MSRFAKFGLLAGLALWLGWPLGARGQVNKILKDFPHGVDCLAFSPYGKILATGTAPSKGGKDAVTLWEVASGKELCRLGDNYPFGCGPLTFTPDGKTLITNGGPDNTLLGLREEEGPPGDQGSARGRRSYFGFARLTDTCGQRL